MDKLIYGLLVLFAKVLLQRNNLQLNNVIQLNDLENGMYYLELFQNDRPIKA